MSVWSDWRALRAFKALPDEQRRIVVYSESGQDWHHFEPVIAELTGRLGRHVCYLSSDPGDPGLTADDPRRHGFAIGAGLVRTVAFQFLQARVALMTMIDLHNLQLKRSINPVHYVFMFHSLISTHMADFAESYDHYDTILCAGPHHVCEIRAREAQTGLPAKQLIPHGYHRVEQFMAAAAERAARPPHDPAHVLLAPSWGDETILNRCGEPLCEALLEAGLRLTLRPHYHTRRLTPEVIDVLLRRYGDHPRFAYIDRMGEDESLFDSDVMITDWSGAGMDYALGLGKPVLYIDLPPKSRNDSWQSLGIEPFESYVRARLGELLPAADIASAPAAIRRLLAASGEFAAGIAALRKEWIYNLGHSAAAAADAIAELADRPPPNPATDEAARRG